MKQANGFTLRLPPEVETKLISLMAQEMTKTKKRTNKTKYIIELINNQHKQMEKTTHEQN